MKNIFLIPTDKPSRLRYNLSNVLVLTKEFYRDYGKQVNCNIYITNDEEIKEGCWCIDDIEGVFKIESLEYFKKFCKKIILTTDQDLINDGVQAIDDEFLVWFVKNSNCEEVETKIEFIQTPDNLNDGFYYKITVPKMNFYCGDEVDYGEQCSEQCDKCVDATGVDYGFLPIENGSMSESIKKVIIDIMQEDEKLGLYDEQETRQKAFASYKQYWNEDHTQLVKSNFITGFLEGVKSEQKCKDCDESLNDCTCIEDTINFPKQETLENIAHKILIDYGIKSMGQSIGVLDVKKLLIKMGEKRYSEEDMINSSKYGYNFHKTTQFPEQEFEDSCIRNTQQWLTQFKKK